MNNRRGYHQVRQVTKEEMREIGEYFMSIRKSLGYNLSEMAEKIGVYRTTLSLWEKGKVVPQEDIYLLKQKFQEALKEKIK